MPSLAYAVRAGAAATLAGATLFAAACSPSPRWIAVAGHGRIVVYDGTLASADTLAVDASGGVSALQFAPDGASLYLAFDTPDGAAVRSVRRTNGEVLGSAAFPGRRLAAVWVAPDTRSVLAVASATTESVLYALSADLEHAQVVTSLCGGPVRAITVFEPARRLFALCAGDRIADVDLELGVVVRTEAFGEAGACGATDLGISANGTMLFAMCPDAGRLLYLDRRTYAVLDSLSVGSGPVRLVQAPDRRHAVFPCAIGKEIVTAHLRERHSTPVAVPFVPSDVAVAMSARTAYAVGGSPGMLVALDLDRGAILGSWPTLPAPTRVAVWPGPQTPVMRWRR